MVIDNRKARLPVGIKNNGVCKIEERRCGWVIVIHEIGE